MAAVRGRGARGKKANKKKKTGKHEARVDKESEAEKAKASAAVWEARLKMAELSRTQYRNAARTLAQNNEELSRNQYQMESDMLDVVGFLKKQDGEKDELIEQLQRELAAEKRRAEEERQQLVETFQKQVESWKEKCAQKAHEMQVIQSEFRMMKEFRRRKTELERNLNEANENLFRANQDHKESLAATERRFFQEKQRLEKEAEKRIMTLAEKAHTEAITQLDDAGRAVFRENVRLKEALSYHMNETRALQKNVSQLQEEKDQLLLEKMVEEETGTGSRMEETNDRLVEEKVRHVAQKKAQIQELERTVKALELALQEMRLEVEGSTQRQKQHMAQQAGGSGELQRLLEVKEREMKRVKKLAHNILQERSEVERFFLEALQQVKQEIKSSRSYYQRMAQAAYNNRMIQAAAGTEPYPRIRTFQNKEHSTNDVSQDLKEAEKWCHEESGRVDIADLTWEQKEKVLRLLFAKMNGSFTR
ncbi:basal body-orientation factor 1 [Gastrophryne carolinensis]